MKTRHNENMRRNPYTKAQGLFSLSGWVLVNTLAATVQESHMVFKPHGSW